MVRFSNTRSEFGLIICEVEEERIVKYGAFHKWILSMVCRCWTVFQSMICVILPFNLTLQFIAKFNSVSNDIFYRFSAWKINKNFERRRILHCLSKSEPKVTKVDLRSILGQDASSEIIKHIYLKDKPKPSKNVCRFLFDFLLSVCR